MSVLAPSFQPTRAAVIPAMLGAAALTHGLASAPVPPAVGAAAVLVALLLVTATGPIRPLRLASGCGAPGEPADTSRCTAAAVLLWLPLLIGLARGAGATALLRDLIPLGFILLALALPPADTNRLPGRPLAAVLAAAEVALALRHLAVVGLVPGRNWALAALPGQPAHHLANDILVLFAAVWLPLAALRLGRSGPVWAYRLPAACAAAAGALVAVAAAAATLQRATLVLAVLAWGYAVVEAACRRDGRPAALATGALGFAALALAGDALAQLFALVQWNGIMAVTHARPTS